MALRELTSDQLSDYLHLDRGDVERLLRETDIPHSVRGGRAIFQTSEIDAWASKRILGLSERRLDAYHEKSMRAAQPILEDDALLPTLLKPEFIELELPAKTKASVIREMVAVADRTGWVYDPRELIASIEAREALCSTAVPGGLALLHARQLEPYRFEQSFLVLGRPVQPIPFGAPDGRPTGLFFLLGCQDERLHLHTLARLCVVALKTDVITQLLAATDREAAFQALVAAEQTVLPSRTTPEK
jgi:mannitol/fructose-specific phosphotransferase system IIA component (Ntr-type)